MREPLLDLLEAVITDSDDALPGFTRWCASHVEEILAIAFAEDDLQTPFSGDLSFEEALTFVRIELRALDGIRSTTGLGQSGQRRYAGLRAMEIDLIGRIS